MIDLLHLPEPDERTVWFPGQGASTDTTGWRVWTKPRGISMVSMILIRSGGGGQGGQGSAFSASATGGSGGDAGTFARYLWLASTLPDKLYILSVGGGYGGAGGTNSVGVSGSAGVNSLASVYPNTNAGNIVASSATTISDLGRMCVAFTATSGRSQIKGGVTTDRGIYSILSSGLTGSPIFNGCGGGGRAANGVGQPGGGWGYSSLGAAQVTIQQQGTAQTGADAPNGFCQYNTLTDFGVMLGGSGGGGNSLGPGGRGGNSSAFGAGGGGGGGGLTTGGAGGNGGPGLVIIHSW